jgi:hypothetical protein
MHGPPLQITIATAPGFAKRSGARRGVSLAGEIQLVKPALLYADVVTLYSPAANLIGSVARLAELTAVEKIALVRQLAPILEPDGGRAFLEGWARYERLKRKRGKSKDELLALLRFERELPRELHRLWNEAMVPPVVTILETSGANELTQAVEANLLRIEPLITDNSDFNTDHVVEALVAKLGDVLSAGGTYPLFDETVSNLVRHGIDEGLFQPSPLAPARSKQVSAAARFMGHLPAFERASIAEVLDVREELRAPLVRFRGAMITLERTIESAAYEADFVDRVDELYREQVAPALQEIDERVRDNVYLQRLIGELVPELKAIMGSILTIGTVAAADLPILIAGVATSLGTRSVIAAAVAAAEKRRQEGKAISQHTLYFLYRTQQLLTE